MSYRLTTSDNTTIATNMTLGNAFTALDNWCYDNKAEYDLDSIYHVFDDTIGITVHMSNGLSKEFKIIQS